MRPNGQYPVYCNGTDTLKTLDGTIDDGSGPFINTCQIRTVAGLYNLLIL